LIFHLQLYQQFFSAMLPAGDLDNANSVFNALVDRVRTLEDAASKYSGMLEFFNTQLHFFQGLPTNLPVAITSLETRATVLETNLKELDDQVGALPRVRQPVSHAHFKEAMDTLRSDMSNNINTVTQASRTSSPAKPRLALPEVFSGKREEWKSFQARVDLFFVANDSTYPTDTDKILFAISRLGPDTAATKMMERYVPSFRKPADERPNMICNLDVFWNYMTKNFGVLNSHVVAEISLRNLKQKGSALDYTNKFTTLAADVKWNNSEDAMISAYRLGLKESVLEAIAREEEPTTFAEFSQLAIDIDTRQYSYTLTRPAARTSTSSTSSSRPVASSHAHRAIAPVTAVESTPSPMDLSQAQHRPIDAAEKQRRKDNDLCGYCGADDHWVRDCPNKPKTSRKPISKPSSFSIPAALAQTCPDSDVTFDLGKDIA
jgi:hypothetical protein